MKIKIIVAVSICFTLACGSLFGATWFVPDDFPTIQDAIDAALAGDAIIVRPGHYPENIDFLGKAVSLLSEEGPEVTTIDGNQAGSVVVFQGGEGPDTVLSGFTITNGQAYSGGGIYCIGSSPEITNNIIIGNSADYSGGGICCEGGSSPEIAGNRITENTTPQFGAGMLTDQSTPAIVSNTFTLNKSSTSAGAIYCHESSVTIAGNMIVHNSAGAFGGALIIDGNSSSMLLNNTISENSTPFWGGGLLCWDGAVVTITNSIFWNNKASYGPEINLDVWDLPTTVNISHSDVKGGQTSVYMLPGCTLNWGAGMIDDDPLFVDSLAVDYHLTIDSPCRNAGDGSAPGLQPEDFEGDPRVVQGAVDIGADEFHRHLYYTGVIVPGAQIELKVIGFPSSGATLCAGSGVLEPPMSTPYGPMFLDWPLSLRYMGAVERNGVLIRQVTVPASWAAGSGHPFQVLTGGKLTNLMVLQVAP